ncbi:MAG: hypothetical protein U9O64_06410 [Campylobacterota bacterium]|nr:hypothetical protein [Campylobacterota bacterium]
MRKIIRYLFWSVLMLGVLIYTADVNNLFNEGLKEKKRHTKLKKGMKKSITYILSSSGSLMFSIPNYTDYVKFLFTANLDLPTDTLENIKDIFYSIEYQIIGSGNKVIASKVHHFKTSYLLYLDKNGSVVKNSFYENSQLLPTNTQPLLIDLDRYPDAKKVSFEIYQKDDRVIDIGMRSYHLERISDDQLDIKWERMSKVKRKELFEGNIYNLYYLTQTEKNMQLSALWRPNGPLGVQGDDYQIRRLVREQNFKGLYSVTGVQPLIYSDTHLHASRLLKQGNYHIKASTIENTQTLLKVKSFLDETLLKTDEYLLKGSQKIGLDLKEDAMVVLESNSSVKYEIKENNASLALFLPPLVSKGYYVTDANHSLEYAFFSQKKRFIRIECRKKEQMHSQIIVLLKNNEGKTVNRLKKEISFIDSFYDYGEGFDPQSEALYLYLEVPKTIRKMEIIASSALLTKVSSRSPIYPYPLYASQKDSKEQLNRTLKWFDMRPKDFYGSAMRERHYQIYKQKHPSDINSFIESGEYRYEQLYPTGAWKGFDVLMKRIRDDQFIRLQGWGSIYSKIDANTFETLELHSQEGVKHIWPKLIYNRRHENEASLSMIKEGKKIFETSLYQRRGILELPKLASKKPYHIKLETQKDTNLFISHTALPSRTYMKRGFLLLEQPMRFVVTKYTHLKETIGVQLAVDHKVPQDISLALSLNISPDSPVALYQDFSFERYQLHFDTTASQALSLTQYNKTFNLSKTLYLTLGENMEPGEYVITLYPSKQMPSTYVYMNHLIPYYDERLRVSKERI